MNIVVQLPSCVWLFATPWTAALQASLSFTIFQSLLKLTSIESVMSSNHLMLCHPLLLLPSIFPKNQGVFQWVSSSHQVAKGNWSFSFSISPSNQYSGLIYFRIDLFDLLAVQGTLKSLLQHHGFKGSVLWCSAFCRSISPIHTALALTIGTSVGNVMSLLLNMLSRFVIAFLPRSQRLLISWLQSRSALVLEPKKIQFLSVSICFSIYLPWSDRTRSMT